MDLRGGPATAGEDEAAKRLEAGTETIGVLFETTDVPIGYPVLGWVLRTRSREFALGDEDLVLQSEQERRRVVPLGDLGRSATEMGAELVVGPDGADAERVLPYAAATQEAGVAAVAGAGV